jgi:uncharacterized protein (DUF305 family)
VAILAACLYPIACASRPETRPAAGTAPVEQSAQQPQAHVHGPQLPATAGPGYTVADVRFMQDMIGHHAQAIVMAAMVPTHGAGESLQRLAQKIDISQKDEIVFMKRWLEERDQAVPADGHAHAMGMPGMLTAEQLAQLDAARGTQFERLFLTFMIQHHRGALQMVEELFDAPAAAQDSDIFRFATDVDADQRDEIFVMQGMLGMLGTGRGAETR